MKKLRRLIIMLMIPFCTFGFTACQGGGNRDNFGYEQITQDKAKEIIKTLLKERYRNKVINEKELDLEVEHYVRMWNNRYTNI